MGCVHHNIFTRKVTDNAFPSDFCNNHSHPCVPVFDVPASPSHTSRRPILDVFKSLVSRSQVQSSHTRVPMSPSQFYTTYYLSFFTFFPFYFDFSFSISFYLSPLSFSCLVLLLDFLFFFCLKFWGKF